jgi:hypothetical protein
MNQLHKIAHHAKDLNIYLNNNVLVIVQENFME